MKAVDLESRIRTLRSAGHLLASPEHQLKMLAEAVVLDATGRPADFEPRVSESGAGALQPVPLEFFQVNLGRLCNMTCRHCHVDAGPDRTDAMMSDETLEDTIAAILRSGARAVDITGGAPELHPRFRDLVEAAVGAGKHAMDRCNLTILLLPRFRDLPAWLASRGVEIVASLPHSRKRNTDAQRGDGTFERSIEAIRRLNRVGYGNGDPHRRLTLVSNPAGAFLPGHQSAMEKDWHVVLEREHGVVFDRLLILNNMPISRFLEWLMDRGQLEEYLRTLIRAFNPAAIDGLMCRNSVSVSWDGRIFDCDFNQMLDLEAQPGAAGGGHVRDFDPERFRTRAIRTARHCFGCTAGAGSSCGGATLALASTRKSSERPRENL